MTVASRDAFIEGTLIHLRALREEDANGPYPEWFNDEEVCRGNSHHALPYTRVQAVEYIVDLRRRSDRLVLAIALRDGGRHVGNVALQGIDPISRSAEFAIIIGDRSAWGQGLGKEAGRLLLVHGFRTLNLHRIHCGTFATNVGMQRLALHLGMREEGRRRSAAFKDGRFVDVLEYGVLRDEFEHRWPAAPHADG